MLRLSKEELWVGFQNYIKTKAAVYEYGDYYSSYRKEIIRLLEYYNAIGYKTVIWGAGQKGTAFLNLIDPKGQYIKAVIDRNKDLFGTNITPRHRTDSLSDVLLSKPDVIIIMNAVHYADNYALLMEKGFNGIILDLDSIIENRKDPVSTPRSSDTKEEEELGFSLEGIHNQILDILKEIDRICRRHGITYFLSAGTALGAIRHQGFIPWDDDADIGMLREDFERFRLVAKEELGNLFYYQRMEKGSQFYRSFDQVGKCNTSYVLYEVKDIKMRHGIHVDIFPFDYVSDDEDIRNEHVKKVQRYRNRLYGKLVPHTVQTRNPWKRLIINHLYYSMKLLPLSCLIRRTEQSLTGYRGIEREYVADLLTHYKKVMYFKVTDILPVAYAEFEGLMLPVPNNYDAYLNMMYGNYWILPPEGKRRQHHRIYKLSCEEAYSRDIEWFGKPD